MPNYKNNESELKICGHYFLVRFIENLRVEGDAHAWGRIHIGRQIIELELDCSDSKKEPIMYPCGRCRELMQSINKKNRTNTNIIIPGKKKIKLKNLLPGEWM